VFFIKFLGVDTNYLVIPWIILVHS